MPLQPNSLHHEELSRLIIGSGMEVLNVLKPGQNENALAIELIRRGLTVSQQERFEVRYRGQLVDTLVPDLIVSGLVIVDPKVVEEFNSTHVAQMTGYLATTGLRLALLLNFKFADLRWKRVVR